MSKLKQTQAKYAHHREPCSTCGNMLTPFAEGTHVMHDFETDTTKFYHWECKAWTARKVEKVIKSAQSRGGEESK